MPLPWSNKKLLLIGASRGLGFALAEEYLKRGWHVVATERVRTTSKLHHLLGADKDRLDLSDASAEVVVSLSTVPIIFTDEIAFWKSSSRIVTSCGCGTVSSAATATG